MSRLLVLPLTAALLLDGCASHRIMVANPNPSGPYRSVQSTALGFGAAERRTVVDCPTNLLDEVRVRQSFGEALLTVVTLGLVAPARVTYRCAKRPTEEGSTSGGGEGGTGQK